MDDPFDSQQSFLIRSLGLTEAEILAIKVFTAGDYRYINPAVADSPEWMESQLEGIQGRMRNDQIADPVKLMQEGKRHAGVMMEGLNKLPPRNGTVYRGERMTVDEFAKVWKDRKTISYSSFASSSTRPEIAEGIAAGNFAREGQTVSVLSRFAVKDARDLAPLSRVTDESEWLILPGTTFTIDKIAPAKTRPAGKPQATEWWEITLTQKPKTIP